MSFPVEENKSNITLLEESRLFEREKDKESEVAHQVRVGNGAETAFCKIISCLSRNMRYLCVGGGGKGGGFGDGRSLLSLYPL